MKRLYSLFSLLVLSLCLVGPANAEKLILASASYGNNVIAICETDGTIIWSYKTQGVTRGHTGHHDVHLLDNGNILFHDNWTVTKEITLDGEVVWQYDSATMNGNKGKRVDVHAFERLPNGHTMIAESGVGRIIEVDKEGKIHREVKMKRDGRQNTRLVRKLDNGNYLTCSENPGVVTEYNPEGEIVWEYHIKTRVYGATRLKNGNTLIASGGGKSVVEVTPDGKVVWEIKDKVPGTDIGLGWMTCVTELENGNFVIGNCHAGDKNPQIFEINRDKKIVWAINRYDVFGNGLACSEVLNDKQSKMVRELINQYKMGKKGRKDIGVGAKPIQGAEVIFDGSRKMLDDKWTYWEGPRYSSSLPIKWKIVDDPVDDGTVVMTDDPAARGGKYGTADVVTKEKYRDFRLHIEFLISKPRGNSGVYLQNRYEIQILDGDRTKHGLGAVINETPSPYHAYNGVGQWNSYDIMFRAARFKDGKRVEKARVTVYFNGQRVHLNQEINKVWGGPNSGIDGGRGITDRPGGLKLQCEGHDVRYRNIWIKPLEIQNPQTGF